MAKIKVTVLTLEVKEIEVSDKEYDRIFSPAPSMKEQERISRKLERMAGAKFGSFEDIRSGGSNKVLLAVEGERKYEVEEV